ncbi:MAG: T9SS type A sorting domain-containing protein [Bacteroidota bacterium]
MARAGIQKENIVSLSSIYPNPVQRSNTFILEYNAQQDEPLQVSVYGMSGKQVLLQSHKTTKG